MSSLAKTMNAEIRRLARREANALVEPLHKAITQLRREIWRLNRDNRALEKKVQQGPRTATGLPAVDPAAAATGKIGPRLIAKLRARLGLSQGEFAVLLDISPNSISNWETGHSRPNTEMRAKLVAARQLGRRAVKRMLTEKADAMASTTKAPDSKKKPGTAQPRITSRLPSKRAAVKPSVQPASGATVSPAVAPSGKRGRK